MRKGIRRKPSQAEALSESIKENEMLGTGRTITDEQWVDFYRRGYLKLGSALEPEELFKSLVENSAGDTGLFEAGTDTVH